MENGVYNLLQSQEDWKLIPSGKTFVVLFDVQV
jgi:hypothetical protein